MNTIPECMQIEDLAREIMADPVVEYDPGNREVETDLIVDTVDGINITERRKFNVREFALMSVFAYQRKLRIDSVDQPDEFNDLIEELVEHMDQIASDRKAAHG